jgi:CubicO group peptidase (beta-lactamase class C family)
MVFPPLVGVLLAVFSISPSDAQTPSPSSTSAVNLQGAAPLPLTGAVRAQFDAYLSDAMNRLGVPGAAVAVQNGQVVYLQGFGVKKAGGDDPVDPDTLFNIASSTKAFTSALAATLIDDGSLSWDTPLVQMLPNFAVADPSLTPRLTEADAFCMCTGVPRSDWQGIFDAFGNTPDRSIATLAATPLTAPYGEEWQYSNQMYAVGGWAAAVAAGGSRDDLLHAYEQAVRDRILNPIGMTSSTFTLDQVLNDGDYADPNANDISGRHQPISLLTTAHLAETANGHVPRALVQRAGHGALAANATGRRRRPGWEAGRLGRQPAADPGAARAVSDVSRPPGHRH